MAPKLWDAVRFRVDNSNDKFILTGSATPKKDKPEHSGVGRITPIRMHTMSLYESGDSDGALSLGRIFDGHEDVAALNAVDIEKIAYLVCRGGWPKAVTEPDHSIATEYANNYITGLIENDVQSVDGVKRSPSRMRQLLRSYARNTAAAASYRTINDDMQEFGKGVSDNTLSDYLDVLRRLYVIEDLEAWTPNLRSQTVLRTTPNRFLTDPSLAAAILGVNPAKLLKDFNTFGLLFECLCIHDLRVYMGALEGNVNYYRDKTGLEIDAVLTMKDGRWALAEIKLTDYQLDTAAAHLAAVAKKIDTKIMGEPSFLAIITGTQAAYTRDDGVLVLPIANLKP